MNTITESAHTENLHVLQYVKKWNPIWFAPPQQTRFSRCKHLWPTPYPWSIDWWEQPFRIKSYLTVFGGSIMFQQVPKVFWPIGDRGFWRDKCHKLKKGCCAGVWKQFWLFCSSYSETYALLYNFAVLYQENIMQQHCVDTRCDCRVKVQIIWQQRGQTDMTTLQKESTNVRQWTCNQEWIQCVLRCTLQQGMKDE